jgi:hypothetical protein
VLSFLAEGEIRKLPCLFFLFFFLKVVKQYSKEQIQKDHHSNDHERNKKEDGTVAIGSCEDYHVHIPTFPSQYCKDENKTVEKVVKVCSGSLYIII